MFDDRLYDIYFFICLFLLQFKCMCFVCHYDCSACSFFLLIFSIFNRPRKIISIHHRIGERDRDTSFNKFFFVPRSPHCSAELLQPHTDLTMTSQSPFEFIMWHVWFLRFFQKFNKNISKAKKQSNFLYIHRRYSVWFWSWTLSKIAIFRECLFLANSARFRHHIIKIASIQRNFLFNFFEKKEDIEERERETSP